MLRPPLYLQRRGRRQDGLVQLGDLLSDALPGEMLGAVTRSVREMRPQSMVREHLRDRFRERLVVARRNEEPRLAVLDERLQAADTGADHGCPARHRLDGDEAERFG